MDWQQKAAALNALGEISIKFRKPGDWYVSQNVDVKDGSILCGEYGNGTTPEEAVLDHWDRLTGVKYPKYLVGRTFFNGSVETRKVVLWNGFMWEDVSEPKREVA